MSQSSDEQSVVKSNMKPTTDQTSSSSSEEKMEKIKVTLDSVENTYCSGQTIRGTISLNCTQKTQVRGIFYRVIGYGKCGWTDLLRRDSVPVDSKTEKSDIKFWGKEEYLNSTVYVIGSKNGRSFPLFKGTTSYNFSYDLKANLPSSFSGDCGKIKYKIEFVVDKPWKFNEKHTVKLNIIQTVDLNSSVGTSQPFEKQLTKNVGFLESGPISLHVRVPKLGYTFQDKIQVQATVSNHSKVRVEKLKFALYKIVEYHSKLPSLAIRRESERLFKKEVEGVAKKSDQTFEQDIDVPVTTPSQDLKSSRLIHIKYELNVELKLGTLYKNLMVTIPIVVGNVPHFAAEADQPVLRSSISQQIPLPQDPRLSVFSNWSLDLQPQISGDRSSVRTSICYFPNTPVAIVPSSGFGSPASSTQAFLISPISSISPIASIPELSAISNNFAQNRPITMNYPPSAPPVDFNIVNASTPIRPQSLFINRPPSYDEVFGFSSQLSQPNTSNSPSTQNTWNKA